MAALRNRKMGDFLNVICDNLDNIDADLFFFKRKLTTPEERMSELSGFVNLYNIDNFKSSTLKDMYENPNLNYYYFIPKIQNATRLFGEEFNVSFPESFLNIIRNNKNFNVIFTNENDYGIDDIEFKLINDTLLLNNLSTSQFYFLNNNSSLIDYKKETNSNINVYTMESLAIVNLTTMSRSKTFYTLDKEFLFLSHNRAVKSHRYGLLCLLKKNNMLDDVDWSLIQGWDFKRRYFNEDGSIDTNMYGRIFTDEEITSMYDEIKYFAQFDFKKSKYEDECSFGEVGNFGPKLDFEKAFNINSFSKSYINITSESEFLSNSIHISEKSYVPFYFYQMPIFLSTRHHIKKLKERYDFDFFDDLIDHSYDEEPNHIKRFFMVFNEITRLYNNKNMVIDFYKNIEHRLQINKDKALSIINNKDDYNFFQNLIYKKNG